MKLPQSAPLPLHENNPAIGILAEKLIKKV